MRRPPARLRTKPLARSHESPRGAARVTAQSSTHESSTIGRNGVHSPPFWRPVPVFEPIGRRFSGKSLGAYVTTAICQAGCKARGAGGCSATAAHEIPPRAGAGSGRAFRLRPHLLLQREQRSLKGMVRSRGLEGNAPNSLKHPAIFLSV